MIVSGEAGAGPGRSRFTEAPENGTSALCQQFATENGLWPRSLDDGDEIPAELGEPLVRRQQLEAHIVLCLRPCVMPYLSRQVDTEANLPLAADWRHDDPYVLLSQQVRLFTEAAGKAAAVILRQGIRAQGPGEGQSTFPVEPCSGDSSEPICGRDHTKLSCAVVGGAPPDDDLVERVPLVTVHPAMMPARRAPRDLLPGRGAGRHAEQEVASGTGPQGWRRRARRQHPRDRHLCVLG